MVQESKERERALAWLKELLRIDTSNPPGNEAPAIEYIARELGALGVPYQVVARDGARPNLIATLPAAAGGTAGGQKAILLSSHIDVVPIESESMWKFPPFSATEHDGMIWGRGALDMKYKTAFDLAVMAECRAKTLVRPLKMVVVSDEEMNCEFGSALLTSTHKDLIDAEYVLNELGGFNVRVGRREVYPIQVGEKGYCQVRLHVQGPGGHGSVPMSNTSISLLARVIVMLQRLFLGFAPSKSSEQFFAGVAESHRGDLQDFFRSFLSLEQVEGALAQIDDPALAAQLKAMLCHTIAATRIGGGFKVNVIPEAAWCDLDCRIVPPMTPESFLKQIQFFLQRALESEGDAALVDRLKAELLNGSVGYEISAEDPVVVKIMNKVRDCWGTGKPPPAVVPMLMPASSDSSHYMRAGIKPIGFAPLRFPAGFPGFSLVHAPNERIPIKSFQEGLDLYVELVRELVVEGGQLI